MKINKLLIMAIIGIASISLSIYLTYMIANSDMPLWLKFLLLK